MTIEQIYNLGIKLGREADPRGAAKSKGASYADSAIHFSYRNLQVKKVLAGIDIGGEELLLADKMQEIDLVIAHHSAGKSLACLSDVMPMQIEMLKSYGLPEKAVKKLIKERQGEFARKIMPINHGRSVDFAKLIKMPFMNLHTPLDNLAAKFLNDLIKKKKSVKISGLIKVLETVPEFREAKKSKTSLQIFSGHKNKTCGKIIVDCTGGVPVGKEIYEHFKKAGVNTVVACRLSDAHRLAAREAGINVVITGHIATDSLGMNLFFDQLAKKGIEIVPCSGLIRVKRL